MTDRIARIAIVGCVAGLLFPACASALVGARIESHPKLLHAVLTKPKGGIAVLALVSRDNPFGTGGRVVAHSGLGHDARVTLELFSRRGSATPRPLGTATNVQELADRPDEARISAVHAFLLTSRLAARVANARSAHLAVLYRLTIRHEIRRTSGGSPHAVRSATTRTATAGLQHPSTSNSGIGDFYSLPNGAVWMDTNGSPATAVIRFQIQGTIGVHRRCEAGVARALRENASYETFNLHGGVIGSDGTFKLVDVQGDLSQWNGTYPLSGWRATSLGGDPIYQQDGTGTPGIFGTFSSDGSGVTVTMAPTDQLMNDDLGSRCQALPSGTLYRMSS
jgi:hypothetical protein